MLGDIIAECASSMVGIGGAAGFSKIEHREVVMWGLAVGVPVIPELEGLPVVTGFSDGE